MTNDSELYKRFRENFGKSFDDFLNGAYNEELQEDNNRWTGYVIDNYDPTFRGRVKVLVIGKYDDIPEASLPWAVPDISYLGSKAGNFIVPETGTVVRGYFDHGDIQKPIFDSVAYSEDNILNSQAAVRNPAEYPDKMILMQTDMGECLTVNRRTGETKFVHRSGTTISISPVGDIKVTAGGASQLAQVSIESELAVNVNAKSMGQINIHAENGNIMVDSDKGQVQLGKNLAKQFVNNLPNCIVTGAPHAVGNTNVTC
jgi:hypothetical protein